jgi:hypothetical protein
MDSWIDSYTKRLLAAGLVTPESLVCSSEENIFAIESDFRIKLPDVYKLFLRRMGRKSGRFMNDCLIAGNSEMATECRQTANSLLEARADYRLTATDFVFIASLGCLVFFFDTVDMNDNPAVFRYVEGEKKPVKIADTLTQAFDMALQDVLNDINDPQVGKPYEFWV